MTSIFDRYATADLIKYEIFRLDQLCDDLLSQCYEVSDMGGLRVRKLVRDKASIIGGGKEFPEQLVSGLSCCIKECMAINNLMRPAECEEPASIESLLRANEGICDSFSLCMSFNYFILAFEILEEDEEISGG